MKPDFQTGIIGAGFGGLIAALRLKQSGRDSFIIFERAADVGGTWRDNVYPGCACDVPSHLYSIASDPNPKWNHAFARQPEIWEYMRNVVKKNQLEKKIRYNADIVDAKFLEEHGLWQVTDRSGRTVAVRMLICASGPLNRQNIPAFKGMENYKGKVFHSASWDHTYDLTRKRVAVVGTGASAIQIVPSIAPQVAQLTVFQRTAAWVTPRRDRKVTGFEKALFSAFPFTQKLYREGQYWLREFIGLSFLGNQTLQKVSRKVALHHLKAVKDPEVRAKLTPNYQLGCKRVLVSDDYYVAFNRPNVQLVTEGIQEITPTGIRTADGQEQEFDVIVLSTGFIAADIDLYTTITGRNGRNLIEEWKQTGAEAYQGITISGFPNLAFMLGPNTGLGHNSVVHIMESQMNYVLEYMRLLENKGDNSILDVKPEVQHTYNAAIQSKFPGTVWNSGCKSWYMNAQGKNTTLYPGLTVTYRKQTRHVNVADYDAYTYNEGKGNQ
jgi:cation diffusion facilitator CzcD-associated flavoprotein CzcO